MNQTEIAVINMQLDTEKVEISAMEVQQALSGLHKIAENICTQISDTFGVALDAIEIFRSSIDKLSESMQSAVGENLSGALTELSEISTALDSILAELKKPDWMEAASLSMQTIDFWGVTHQGGRQKTRGSMNLANQLYLATEKVNIAPKPQKHLASRQVELARSLDWMQWMAHWAIS